MLKSLETKKLIKAVKCVNATKKKVYMLYDLEPDRTVTGIAVVKLSEKISPHPLLSNKQVYPQVSRDDCAEIIQAVSLYSHSLQNC